MGAARGWGAALVALQLAWAGEAAAQLFGGDTEARNRIETVRTELLISLQKVQDRMQALESTSVERRAVLDLAGQMEALRAELMRSRGQIEVLLHQMEAADKRQKDLYVDIDTRLRKLEQGAESIKKIKSVSGGLKVTKDLAAAVQVSTGDADAAKELSDLARVGQFFLAGAAKENKEFGPLADEVLKTLKIETAQGDVKISFKVGEDTIEKALKLIPKKD